MSSVEVYSSITKTPADVIQDLIVSSESAYSFMAQIGIYAATEIHRLPYCKDVIPFMIDALIHQEKAYRVSRVITCVSNVPHTYLSLDLSDPDMRVFADPTYQQFLAKRQRTPALPKMLLGTTDEIVAQALSYGFSQNEVGAWVPDAC